MVRFPNPAASAHRTVGGGKAFTLKPFPLLLVFGLVFLWTGALEAQVKLTRIVVQKKIAAAFISGSPFSAVSSGRHATTGYSQPNSAASDNVNNVEQIIIPPGIYPSGTQLTVYVHANNITEDMWGFPPYCLGPGGTPPCIEVFQDFALFAENAR